MLENTQHYYLKALIEREFILNKMSPTEFRTFFCACKRLVEEQRLSNSEKQCLNLIYLQITNPSIVLNTLLNTVSARNTQLISITYVMFYMLEYCKNENTTFFDITPIDWFEERYQNLVSASYKPLKNPYNLTSAIRSSAPYYKKLPLVLMTILVTPILYHSLIDNSLFEKYSISIEDYKRNVILFFIPLLLIIGSTHEVIKYGCTYKSSFFKFTPANEAVKLLDDFKADIECARNNPNVEHFKND